MTNMDKLYEAVEARGPVCVGLDTDFSYLPADFVDSTLSKGETIVRLLRVPGPRGSEGLCRHPEGCPRGRCAGHRRHQARRHRQDR